MGYPVGAGLGIGLAFGVVARAVADASGYRPGEGGALVRLADWAGHPEAWRTGPMLLALATAVLLIRSVRLPRLGPAGPLLAVALASGLGLASGLPPARLPAAELAALTALVVLGPYRDRWALLALLGAGALGLVPPSVPAALVACSALRTLAGYVPELRTLPASAALTLWATAAATALL
ncbi:hypothetical protein [Streptacidiphilus sp. MAP12-20]|uniref:hypothetical protein n=1 Tax=Streptacidiphilus sp. MAP12-20 TaxID=3156299 RepID=UPI0035196B56